MNTNKNMINIFFKYLTYKEKILYFFNNGLNIKKHFKLQFKFTFIAKQMCQCLF